MKTSHMKRANRIRQIQSAEGNFDYFGTSNKPKGQSSTGFARG
jgi:hypothetical protein